MGFLIDTNVLSEMRKGERANSNVREWAARTTANDLFLSVHDIVLVTRNVRDVARTGARLLDPFAPI